MRPAASCRKWRKARRRSWITQARRSPGAVTKAVQVIQVPPPARTQRFSLPAAPPVTEDEIYAALVSWGGLVVAAESGITTELVRPDGTVAGRIVPA